MLTMLCRPAASRCLGFAWMTSACCSRKCSCCCAYCGSTVGPVCPFRGFSLGSGSSTLAGYFAVGCLIFCSCLRSGATPIHSGPTSLVCRPWTSSCCIHHGPGPWTMCSIKKIIVRDDFRCHCRPRHSCSCYYSECSFCSYSTCRRHHRAAPCHGPQCPGFGIPGWHSKSYCCDHCLTSAYCYCYSCLEFNLEN